MILLCFGTRPEWLKIKPLVKILKKDQYKLLFTGQHVDLLKNIDFDYKIDIDGSSNRLDAIISSCMLQFPEGDFNSIMIQGDTASVFACGLAAYNRRLKIYYLEAGLRSYNLNHPYPEEAYRQMVSRLADVNLCPTELSKQNLINERVSGECYVVGNTSLDGLVEYKDKCVYSNKVLITLHRRENHYIMDKWFSEVNKLAKQYNELEFIIPLHPNPNVQKHRHLLDNIKVTDPMSHNQLLEIMTQCKLIISDSGGIQEEGSFLNKKVIVCRQVTERPEAIDTGHLYICKSPKQLSNIFANVNNNSYINTDCPYGDGRSAQKILNILEEKI